MCIQGNVGCQRRIQGRRTERTSPPPPPVYWGGGGKWLFLKNLTASHAYTFTVVNKQCFTMFILLSMISLQIHRVCVKGHVKTIPRPLPPFPSRPVGRNFQRGFRSIDRGFGGRSRRPEALWYLVQNPAI